MTEHLPVDTSSSDDRAYDYLILPNQLRALVISDPSADKAGAALTADVGYFSDPEEFQGLAHFLEHMLFMGTEKYPDEAEYSKYINEHGGSNNAYTSTSLTNYQFEIDPEYLQGALDRFAQFFISPLFTEAATEREMQAVDSENSKNLQDDMWRKIELLKSLAHQDNPWRKFGTGNLETLGKDPCATREALLKFHKDYYSANRLCLCVLGKEPLEELVPLVERLFGEVKDQQIEPPYFSVNETTCFGHESDLTVTRWVPVQQQRMVELMWAVPPVQGFHNKGSNPCKYLTHLIGHEGKGSILALLKQKGWATSLSAGPIQDVREFSVLFVGISLTESGLEHWEGVVAAVMQYMAMLHREGCQEYVHRECKEVLDMSFKFISKSSPFSYCTGLAASMQKYTPAETVSAPYLMKAHDPAAVDQVLSQLLKLDNLRLLLSAPEFAELPELQSERWYGTKHCSSPFTPEQVAMWNPCSAAPEPALTLPAPNLFICTDFELVEAQEPAAVQLLQNEPSHQLWYKLDGKQGAFGLPKLSVQCELALPSGYSSPRHAVYAKLFSLILCDKLAELAYDADIAELEHAVQHTQRGLKLHFYGYNHKLSKLVHIVFKQLCFTPDQQSFDIQRAKYTQQLTNFFLGQPYSVCDYELSVLLAPGKFHQSEYLEVLESVDYTELLAHSKELLRSGHMSMLVHGNMSKPHALQLCTEVREILALATPESSSAEMQVMALPPNTEHRYHTQNANPEEPNSCVELYMQLGYQQLRDGALLDLMSEIIRDACFETLRTQQQLGYIVFSGSHFLHHVSGFRVIVQSSNTAPQQVYERILEFLDQHRATAMQEMAEDAFNEIKSGLMAKKLQKENNLTQECGKHWAEIESKAYMFGRKTQVAKELESVTKQELLAFYDAHFAAGVRRTLVVMTHGSEHPIQPDPEPAITVQDRVGFRQAAELHPGAPPVCRLEEWEAQRAAQA